MNLLYRNNINILGSGRKAMIFVHGFGCDISVWGKIIPAFQKDYKIILIDLVGCGHSNTLAYDEDRYSSLQGYADDIKEICDFLKLDNVIMVGHDVGGIISSLSAVTIDDRIKKLVMISSNPCYLNKKNYGGGMTRREVTQTLADIDADYMGWAIANAPTMAGSMETDGLSRAIADNMCHTDPEIAFHFARTMLLSDNRKHLSNIEADTLLIQGEEDPLVPLGVGDFMHETIHRCEMVLLSTDGHFPQMSVPEEVASAMRIFL